MLCVGECLAFMEDELDEFELDEDEGVDEEADDEEEDDDDDDEDAVDDAESRLEVALRLFWYD